MHGSAERAMRDFWLTCGHHLLDRNDGLRWAVTDAFLKAYLARPEIRPPREACAAERQLHQALLADPRRAIASAAIGAIGNADARENWQLFITWRDHLARHATIEEAYVDLVRNRRNFPPIFVNQLAHVILRNALEGASDAFVLRAAELFFRPQKLTLYEGSLLAADEESVLARTGAAPSPLLSMLGLPLTQDLDILAEANAASYWERSDRFDMVLDLTAGRHGLAALGEVIVRWVWHLLAVRVRIEPLQELREAPLAWYVGLDAEGTRVGDALWRSGRLAEGSGRVVALYRLEFVEPELMLEEVRGQPVFLISAMSGDGLLRMKPQNLITGLPMRAQGAVP